MGGGGEINPNMPVCGFDYKKQFVPISSSYKRKIINLMQSVIIAQYILFSSVIIKRLYIYYSKNLQIYTDWFQNISGLTGSVLQNYYSELHSG